MKAFTIGEVIFFFSIMCLFGYIAGFMWYLFVHWILTFDWSDQLLQSEAAGIVIFAFLAICFFVIEEGRA